MAGLNLLLQIAGLFGRLSLLAVGGVNSTLPAISDEVVGRLHWMTAAQFAQLFAIAQSAPGPNVLVVVLVGQHVGGVAGGLVAAASMVLPAGSLVFVVSGVWQRFRAARWRRVLQAGILPITGGLLLAAAFVLVRAADGSLLLAAVTCGTAFMSLRTKLHPLWLLAGGTIVGLTFL